MASNTFNMIKNVNNYKNLKQISFQINDKHKFIQIQQLKKTINPLIYVNELECIYQVVDKKQLKMFNDLWMVLFPSLSKFKI